MRLNLYKKTSALSFTLALIFFSPCINAQHLEKISPFKNLIAFTTQHSVKLEITFNETPSPNTKFAVKIMDDKSGKIVFEQPVTAILLKEENKRNFTITNLSV